MNATIQAVAAGRTCSDQDLFGASLGTAGAEPGANASEVIKKKKTFETTLTLDEVRLNGDQARGKVLSPKALCLSGRTVTLRATGTTYGDRILGTGMSKKDGTYSVKSEDKLPPSGQAYSTSVSKKVTRTVKKKRNGDKVIKKKICLPATSNTLLNPTS